jgi:2-polyprenyl-3-methyl-5-hydroxy-6-metoxy-1,4-benzoquinol methylase
MATHSVEIASGERFEFGENWTRFLAHLDEDRILEAERSLRKSLEVEDLKGQSFLDIGSGSGLFSLAARRLGARVHSFDYDPKWVACTTELKRRYFPSDPSWRVDEGSVLDARYLATLGQFDIVYSWGVLHHTGQMWNAIANAAALVRAEGQLFISIYNKQVYWTRFFTGVKRAYSRSPAPGKAVIAGSYIAAEVLKGAVKDSLLLRNPLRRYRDYRKTRGMSTWHDWIDWVGGYPFEVAAPDEIFHFLRGHGFTLKHLTTCGPGHGCNEYVFVRRSLVQGTGSSQSGGASRESQRAELSGTA